MSMIMRDRGGITGRVAGIVAAVLTVSLLSGCTSTTQARKTTPSGFLGDYSQLRKGQGDEALLVYVNPRADFRTYKAILMDPVRVYATKDSSLAKLPKEDLQNLVNYLDATLREHLKTDYSLVTAAGPGVMRLRVAITEAKGARVIMDTISTAMPIGLALSAVKRVATGSHSAVGSVGVECEGLDSVSQARLFAAVDERVGRKITGKLDKFKKWRTANDAFDYWATRLQARLKEQSSTDAP